MWPSDERPNYGIFVKQLADALVNEGIEVDVAATPDFRRGSLSALRKYTRLFIKVVKKKGPYDIVQAEFFFPPAFFISLLRRFKKSKRVYVFHGSDLYLYRRIPFGRQIYARTIRSASAVVVPTASFLDEALRLFPELNNVRVEIIPRGVVEHFFRESTDRAAARKKLGLPLDKVVIVSTGNLIPLKNFDTLIESAAQLKDRGIKLVIIGEGPERRKLEELARVRGVDLVLPGAVKNEGLPLWYSAADIYVAPSQRESLGIALREAMASGLPVVASRIPPHLEAVSDECGLTFDPNSQKELAEKLTLLIDNDKLRQSMAKKAKEKMSSMSLSNTAQKYIELYSSLIEGGER